MRLGGVSPRDLARGLRPEALRIGAPAIIGLPIAAGHRFAPSATELRRVVVARELSRLGASERNVSRSGGRADNPIGRRLQEKDRMSGETQFYLVAIPAVILLGLSKGGFSGLGSLAMPMMSLVSSPVRAAAIVLPILIVQDWVSVWAFRRDYSLRNLVILTPSAVIGVGLGWLLAARVSDDVVRLAIGVISIAFVAYMLIRDRLGRAPVEKPGVPSGVLWGSLSGFTSFVSHAGAPPFQVYVMPQYLEPRIFAGTATIFFAAVNLLKLPGYFLLGQLSPDNLVVSAWLLPVAVLSTFAGVWLVRRVSRRPVLCRHSRADLPYRSEIDL